MNNKEDYDNSIDDILEILCDNYSLERVLTLEDYIDKVFKRVKEKSYEYYVEYERRIKTE